MAAPLFSVILPVFNRASQLGRALNSVLAQSCQDFEIIVVDDGSTDDPRAVVEAIGDPRIRFIRQDKPAAVARPATPPSTPRKDASSPRWIPTTCSCPIIWNA